MKKITRIAILGVLFAILGPKNAFAGDIVVSNFGGGLDTLDSPAALDPSQAQDLLNVQFQPGGSAVYKRDGYGLYATLPISCSTCAVHGAYHFQQVGGNDVQLWGNDQELAGSVNDAAFVKLATGTVGATWQCADSQGFAYCLDSSRDTAVKTDGSVANTSFQAGIPLGTMLAFTPTQLCVAGVVNNESTIYVSQQNAFTTFTVGTLPSSAFTEPIASPGSRITHLAYYFGKLFWWKDQSFGFATFTNQNDWQLTIVSNQIGTLDNSDAFWNSSGFDTGAKFTGTAQANAEKSPGGIFFRGQDNHLYVYDGYYLTRLSRVITPSVTAASRKKANSWTQTSQANFQNGVSTPSYAVSFTISPNDVIISSFQTVENSSTQWMNGIANNMSVWPSSITLSTNNSGNVLNNSFETQDGASSYASSWTAITANRMLRSGNCPAQNGSWDLQTGIPFGSSLTSFVFHFLDASNNVLYTEDLTGTPVTDCLHAGWIQGTASSAGLVGRRVKFHFFAQGSFATYEAATNQTYVLGGDVTFYYRISTTGGNASVEVDNVQNGSSTITSGSFTSQVLNTGFTNSYVQIATFSYVSNTVTPVFDLQTSANSTGPWTEITTATGANVVAKQYLLYSSTITLNSTDSALSSISNVSIVARSTGSYYSAVNNAPNITSWSTLNITDSVNGNSSITYYSRSSTNSFTTLSSTPSWVAQTKNATVSASTGTYFQLRGDFAITAATETPTLNDFTFNWNEGSASDKAYMTYFNDAIWFSVSSSSSVSTNNRIFYWDILNGAWTIFDIPSDGFLIENNTLYFGSPLGPYVYKFGGVSSDNNAAINSYWRSKSFLGQDPFVQNEYQQADFVMAESSTTLTYTYTIDSKTSTSYSMNLFDSSASLIQRNFLLPPGKIGKYYDFKVSDNSTNPPWKVMAHRCRFNPLNWKPVTQ